MSMRVWLRGPRLPFGLRAGISLPLSDIIRSRPQRQTGAAASPSNLSYVYVIASKTGTVKVGYSTNPQMRLASLQTASPDQLRLADVLATDIDGRMIEAEAHRILDRHRLAGEWFDVSPDVAFEAVRQAALNLGLPVALTDSDRLADAVRSGVTSLSDIPPNRPSASLRFFFYLSLMLGCMMAACILIAAGTDDHMTSNGPLPIIIMLIGMAGPFFFIASRLDRRLRPTPVTTSETNLQTTP